MRSDSHWGSAVIVLGCSATARALADAARRASSSMTLNWKKGADRRGSCPCVKRSRRSATAGDAIGDAASDRDDAVVDDDEAPALFSDVADAPPAAAEAAAAAVLMFERGLDLFGEEPSGDDGEASAYWF